MELAELFAIEGLHRDAAAQLAGMVIGASMVPAYRRAARHGVPPSSPFWYQDRESMKLMKRAKHEAASLPAIRAARATQAPVQIAVGATGREKPISGVYAPWEKPPAVTVDPERAFTATGTLAHELAHHVQRTQMGELPRRQEEAIATMMASPTLRFVGPTYEASQPIVDVLLARRKRR